MNIKQLIEEIDKLTEDELVDDFEDVDVQDVNPAGTTEKLDAKTKISRALDVLKGAIEDFKNTTVEEVDLINDADLVACFESLDEVADKIAMVLDGNKEATESESNAEEEPIEDVEDESEEVEEVDANEDEPEEDIDFDAEAELDLFGEE